MIQVLKRAFYANLNYFPGLFAKIKNHLLHESFNPIVHPVNIFYKG